MKTSLPFLLLTLALLPSHLLLAQQPADSTHLLREVEVLSPRLAPRQTGLEVLTFDSTQLQTYHQQNLADLLTDESPLFIKSYGLGSLATSSFRGGSAYHTAVLWNGISLASPMNGLVDFSLLPVAAADELYIQEGAGSALFGSGAVAGAIHLVSKPRFNRGTTASLDASFGSFADFRQNASVEISREKGVSSIQLFHTTAQNNFPFENTYAPGSPRVQQTHAQLRNLGFINENQWQLGAHHTLQLNAWLQTTHRNIPPTLLQQESHAAQQDDALRLHAAWNYTRQRTATFVRAAWLEERLVYTDSLSGLDAVTNTRSLVAEAETKITFHPQHALNLGLHHTTATASNENFPENPLQNRTAAFGAYDVNAFAQKLNAQLSGRAELVNGSAVPFTFSAGADYQLVSWLKLRASVAKVYRLPTFNDLYWEPGGNPNLQPESGYAQEVGADVVVQGKALRLESGMTGFSRTIDHWIIWMPGLSYWSPHNILEVWSRGVETQSTLSYTRGKTRIALTLLTNYVLAENQKATSADDASVGKQLIYTPIYSGMAKVSVNYKQFMAFYRHNYTGYRYTSTDHSQYLAPFDLGAVHVAYRFAHKPFSGRVFFEVNNLWNEQYQVLSNRPMPGINFQVGISIRFHQPRNNSSS